MKNYKQMAEAVFSARDAYLRKKQHQKQLVFRYVPVMASFSFAVLIGLHIWKEKEELPRIQNLPELVTEADSEIISLTETESESKSESTEESNFTETLLIIASESESESVPESVPESESEISVTEFTESSETSIIMTETDQETEIIQPETSSPETEAIRTETAVETLSPETETEVPTQIQITLPAEIPEIPETSGSSEETQESVMPCEESAESETVQEELSETPDQTGIVSRIFLHSALNMDGSNEDTVFCSTGYRVPESLVSDWFDTVDVNLIYPDGSVRLLENIGNAYLVKNTPYGKLVAVRFEGEEIYYLFRSEELETEEFQNLLSESGILSKGDE